MAGVNFFQALCISWAAIGIGSRLAMAVMGPRWASWETEKAYSERRPAWIYLVGIFLLTALPYTWYQVFTGSVAYGWILAVLFSLTTIKMYTIMFEYEKFRSFVSSALADPKTMARINISVLVLSAAMLIMAFTLYA